MSFIHTGCGNAIPDRNEGIAPCNFSINTLKDHRIYNKKKIKIPARIYSFISPNKKSTNPMECEYNGKYAPNPPTSTQHKHHLINYS